MIETYQSKWKQFINEEKQSSMPPYEEFKELLIDKGGKEEDVKAYIESLKINPRNEGAVKAYLESLKDDMKINMTQYSDFTSNDFIEDFENYVGDKMGS
jgi:hypothetical protein